MLNDTKLKVIAFFYQNEGTFRKEEVAESLSLDLSEVSKIIYQIQKEKLIKSIRKDIYTRENYVLGMVTKTKKGSSFLVVEGESDIFIPASALNHALDGDIVLLKITTLKNEFNRKEGTVFRIIDHGHKTRVGEVFEQNGSWYIKPDKKNENILIKIKPDDKTINGNKVVFSLGELERQNIYDGQIIKVIGHKDDPGVDILSVASEYDIDPEFSKETLEEVKNIPTFVSEEEIEGRLDLRGETIVTLDGEKTKDMDDAIGTKKLDNGHYILEVDIADVPYYVKEGSAIDRDAYLRGTSYYLANTSIPMLPRELSNGICSLNEGVDRLTTSCLLEYDETGKRVRYSIVPSAIRSSKKMTYEKFNAFLKEESVEEYGPFASMIKTMQELYLLIRKRREQSGYIDFDAPEYEVVIDENGKTVDVVPRERGDGERLIEMFMIEANEAVAEEMSYSGLPGVYRVHGEPNKEGLFEVRTILRIMKEKVAPFPKTMHSSIIKKLLEDLKESPKYTIYAQFILRCMAKAVYSPDNIGHFGLASEHYTHFTSPIRRYPDLMVHRILNVIQDEKKYGKAVENLEEQTAYLEAATKWSSERERAADQCERAVLKMKMAEYMESHVHEQYKGMITSFARNGMYVHLYHGIEGLLKYSDIPYALYKPEAYCVEAKGKTYYLGDTILVEVASASKEYSQIDVVLAPEGTQKVLKPIK